ncbi:MAG: D-Ala-D-Ala carboxypeptidase family metallohydrolase [Pseudomonadota bacterium]
MTLERYVTSKMFFAWNEFLVSDSHPELVKKFFLTAHDKKVIQLGVQAILDPLREHFNKPYRITSGKRSAALNEAVGGATTSDHLTANAVDGFVEGVDSLELFKTILEMQLPYREVIYYPKAEVPFVHVSWNIPGKFYRHDAKIIP